MSVKQKIETPEVIRPAAEQNSLTLSPAERVERILALHAGAREALDRFVERVVMCGVELLALKAQVGHAKWSGFFEENLAARGFSERSALRYMEAAKVARRRLTAAGNGPLAMLGPDGLAGADGAALREALSDTTDATTWEQLWMDFGLMRAARPRGGARAAGAKEQHVLADGETADHSAALDLWRTALGALRLDVDGAQMFRHLEMAELKRASEELLDLRRTVDAEIKRRA
jgi:hypothetical protein